MNIKKHIPNTLTCCNLLCGCVATHLAFENKYALALTFIVAGAVFDFLDGFAARLCETSSLMGKELDSLADVITFGFAPATMVFSFLARAAFPAWVGAWGVFLLPFTAFFIAAFSALRLAKFNIDQRQTSSFIGLPTPANALFWSSAILAVNDIGVLSGASVYCTLALIVLSCYLLISEIPMFALKFKHFGWEENKLRYIFLLVSVVLLALHKIMGIAMVVVWYIALSLFTQHKEQEKV